MRHESAGVQEQELGEQQGQRESETDAAQYVLGQLGSSQHKRALTAIACKEGVRESSESESGGGVQARVQTELFGDSDTHKFRPNGHVRPASAPGPDWLG